MCGQICTCAVTSTGSIFTWGFELSNDVLKPRLLQDLSSKGVVSVSAHYYHIACVTKTGQVFTWGNDYYGRLGHGDSRNQPTPKRVEALVGVKANMVSCGGNHNAVCTEDGHVYTFGRGEEGQLGHGDEKNRTSPALVQGLEGRHIEQVHCGDFHTMALTSSGYVFTWGSTKDQKLVTS
jgi:E3 ubiquitin-protein ligase HERC2